MSEMSEMSEVSEVSEGFQLPTYIAVDHMPSQMLPRAISSKFAASVSSVVTLSGLTNVRSGRFPGTATLPISIHDAQSAPNSALNSQHCLCPPMGCCTSTSRWGRGRRGRRGLDEAYWFGGIKSIEGKGNRACKVYQDYSCLGSSNYSLVVRGII